MPAGFILAMLLQAGEAPPAPPPPASSAADPQRPWETQQSFIAPSGEPFRASMDQPYPSALWFAQADANHDGKLTFAEFNADFIRFFEKLDTNHDNTIDAAELETYQNRVAPEVHASAYAAMPDGRGGTRRGKNGGYYREDYGGGGDGESTYRPIGSSFNGYGPPRGAARFDLLRINDPVAAMDTSFNGRISRAEALEAAEQRFDQLDTDKKGYLSLDGLPESFVQERMGKGRR